jgi:hypothetical protein
VALGRGFDPLVLFGVSSAATASTSASSASFSLANTSSTLGGEQQALRKKLSGSDASCEGVESSFASPQKIWMLLTACASAARCVSCGAAYRRTGGRA